MVNVIFASISLVLAFGAFVLLVFLSRYTPKAEDRFTVWILRAIAVFTGVGLLLSGANGINDATTVSAPNGGAALVYDNGQLEGAFTGSHSFAKLPDATVVPFSLRATTSNFVGDPGTAEKGITQLRCMKVNIAYGGSACVYLSVIWSIGWRYPSLGWDPSNSLADDIYRRYNYLDTSHLFTRLIRPTVNTALRQTFEGYDPLGSHPSYADLSGALAQNLAPTDTAQYLDLYVAISRVDHWDPATAAALQAQTDQAQARAVLGIASPAYQACVAKLNSWVIARLPDTFYCTDSGPVLIKGQ